MNVLFGWKQLKALHWIIVNQSCFMSHTMNVMLFLFFTSFQQDACALFFLFSHVLLLECIKFICQVFFSAQFISKAPFLSILFCLKGGSFASKYSSKILGIIDTRLVIMASRILWYIFFVAGMIHLILINFTGKKNSEDRVLIIFIQEVFFTFAIVFLDV